MADQDLVFVAEQLRYWLASQPRSQPILVTSDAKYTLLRLIYLLLPDNMALLDQVEGKPPAGSLILLYESKHYRYDAARGVVIGRGQTYRVEPVFNGGGAYLYRVKAGGS